MTLATTGVSSPLPEQRLPLLHLLLAPDLAKHRHFYRVEPSANGAVANNTGGAIGHIALRFMPVYRLRKGPNDAILIYRIDKTAAEALLRPQFAASLTI